MARETPSRRRWRPPSGCPPRASAGPPRPAPDPSAGGRPGRRRRAAAPPPGAASGGLACAPEPRPPDPWGRPGAPAGSCVPADCGVRGRWGQQSAYAVEHVGAQHLVGHVGEEDDRIAARGDRLHRPDPLPAPGVRPRDDVVGPHRDLHQAVVRVAPTDQRDVVEEHAERPTMGEYDVHPALQHRPPGPLGGLRLRPRRAAPPGRPPGARPGRRAGAPWPGSGTGSRSWSAAAARRSGAARCAGSRARRTGRARRAGSGCGCRPRDRRSCRPA